MGNSTSRYQLLLRVLGALYFISGIFCFFFPEQTIFLLNLPANLFHVTGSDLQALSPLARVLGSSYFVTLTALALLSAERPHLSGFSTLHVFSLFTLSLCSFWTYFKERAEFALVFSGSISAILVIAVTWGAFTAFWSARRSKKYETRKETQTPSKESVDPVSKEPLS